MAEELSITEAHAHDPEHDHDEDHGGSESSRRLHRRLLDLAQGTAEANTSEEGSAVEASGHGDHAHDDHSEEHSDGAEADSAAWVLTAASLEELGASNAGAEAFAHNSSAVSCITAQHSASLVNKPGDGHEPYALHSCCMLRGMARSSFILASRWGLARLRYSCGNMHRHSLVVGCSKLRTASSMALRDHGFEGPASKDQ